MFYLLIWLLIGMVAVGVSMLVVWNDGDDTRVEHLPYVVLGIIWGPVTFVFVVVAILMVALAKIKRNRTVLFKGRSKT